MDTGTNIAGARLRFRDLILLVGVCAASVFVVALVTPANAEQDAATKVEPAQAGPLSAAAETGQRTRVATGPETGQFAWLEPSALISSGVIESLTFDGPYDVYDQAEGGEVCLLVLPFGGRRAHWY